MATRPRNVPRRHRGADRRAAEWERKEAERSYLAAVLELLTDDPDRCRDSVRGVPLAALTIDYGSDLLAAVVATLEVGPGPKIADLAATIRRQADAPAEVMALAGELVGLSTASPKAYALGADRHRGAVLEGHQVRCIAHAVADLDAIRANGGSVAEIIAAAEAVKLAATETAGGGGRLLSIAEAIQDWRTRERAPIVETGFGPLDCLSDGGLPVGGLAVLAGAPGTGKSALALQATLGALHLDPGLRAVWAAGEMGVEAIARRAVVAWAAGPGGRRVSMHGAGERTKGALEAAGHLEQAIGERLQILPAPIPIGEIVTAVIAARARLAVIDYVQLVEASGATDRRAEVDAVVRALRTLATQHNVALLVVSNVAKNVGADARAGMIGKESSEIDFAADLLLLGVADEAEGNDRTRSVRWRCLKNRHGERRDLETVFDGARQTFTAVASGGRGVRRLRAGRRPPMTRMQTGPRARADAPPDARGELQRRVGAILEAGADRNLSRSSLRVFMQCRQWASFERCTFKVSLRTLCRALGVGTTTAHRGLEGLVDAGIIRQREESPNGYRVFEIVIPKSVRPAVRRDDRGVEPPWE